MKLEFIHSINDLGNIRMDIVQMDSPVVEASVSRAEDLWEMKRSAAILTIKERVLSMRSAGRDSEFSFLRQMIQFLVPDTENAFPEESATARVEVVSRFLLEEA